MSQLRLVGHDPTFYNVLEMEAMSPQLKLENSLLGLQICGDFSDMVNDLVNPDQCTFVERKKSKGRQRVQNMPMLCRELHYETYVLTQLWSVNQWDIYERPLLELTLVSDYDQTPLQGQITYTNTPRNRDMMVGVEQMIEKYEGELPNPWQLIAKDAVDAWKYVSNPSRRVRALRRG